jgi:hypothetical protein
MAFAGMRPIAEYAAVGSTEFLEKIRPLGQPAVLRGLAADWPAVVAGRRSDEDLIAYLRRFHVERPVAAIVGGPEIGGRFFYTEDYRALNFQRAMTPLDSFLDRLLRDRQTPNPYAIAVQSEEVPALLPGFEKENATDLVDPKVVPRAWIGNRIRVAPHYDLMENIGVVVAGRRQFIVFPPEQLSNLYVGPFELTPAGTPVSLVDTHGPDFERFPRFREALAHAQVAELEPGDAIYIPFHWWHGVDSLEPVNLFINYWWNEGRADAGSPYDALLHALYAIKTLPPDQRAVWRTVFDHYVFEADGDPVGHLPEAARGMLGEPTPDLLGRMRNTLRQLLNRP